MWASPYSPKAHHDLAQDLVIGTCYNIDPALKLEPTSTKWQAHRCWHKICCAAQNQLKYPGPHILFDRECHCVWMSQVSNQAINKHVYDNQRTLWLQMVGSCWWNSACLCVLWSYNKQWSNGRIISYISFIQTSPRHTDLRQLQGSRDKKQHEPSNSI